MMAYAAWCLHFAAAIAATAILVSFAVLAGCLVAIVFKAILGKEDSP